jgi:hypothetical protein
MQVQTARRSCLATALILLAFLGATPPAVAWGRLGHRVISQIAEKQLTPAARAAIAELLEPGESLADASTWADEVRGRMRETAPWHYVEGLPDTHRMARGILIAANRSECGCLEASSRTILCRALPRDIT